MTIQSVLSPSPGLFNIFTEVQYVPPRKTKPDFCPECQAHLGGKYVAKVKAKKPPTSAGGDVVLVGLDKYSVRYHQHFK